MAMLFDNDKAVQILHECMKRKYISLEDLATKLSVSTRTIRNYIKQLNSDLNSVAYIENIRGKGYRLFVDDKKYFQNIINQIHEERKNHDSFQKRIAIIIGNLMNENKKNTLDELAFEMNIGRTTLVNDLKKAAVVLDTYQLKIIGKQNNGMYLVGEEQSIRFFILEHIYEFLYGRYSLDPDIEEAILSIAYNHDFDKESTELLMKSVTILLDRVINNYLIENIDEKFTKLMHTNDFQIASKIKQVIEKLLPIEIPSKEILFITIPIATRRTPTRTSSMIDIQITPKVQKILDIIMEKMSYELNIVLDNEEFLHDFTYHMTLMLNRIIFGIHIKNPIINEVKQKYPLSYKMAEITGKAIEEEFDVTVSEDELGYLSFHYGVYLDEHDVQIRNLNKVAIVCETGRGTAKLISIQLKRILSSKTKVDLYSHLDASAINLSKYGVVFTTMPLPFALQIPVIEISEIFDESRVRKQIEEAIYLNGARAKEDENLKLNCSLLGTLLHKDKLFYLSSKKGYMENMNDMANYLINEEFVDEGFVDRLNEREKKSTMVFDRLIAFPHTVHYQSNKVVLSLGVIDAPVKTRTGKKVQLIFMLGLPEMKAYDASLLVPIYDEMLKISSNEQEVLKIAKTKSYEDLLAVLDNSSFS
ncbi:BglG family transcription antiterminator [Oceanobacillus jeddahense]|uniref:BglG family transcription antiterminator n=1 Tax=Oceanobacillus jeddahense TaxID=1462527 RepID=UPI000596188F|nr:BglG family transcription antiterminator [Oceanobacillus jeddahense]